MTGRVDGRRILVTGAGGGIGFACAERFAREGAGVALLDRDHEAGLRAEARLGAPHVFVAADVTDTASVATAIARSVAALGGLDGVVNAAGIDLDRSLADMADAEWDKVLAVNLTGSMRVCRAAIPHLRRAAAATIVNVASGAGLFPLEGRAAYAASKAGLIMLGKVLARELAGDGIRVNAVCPGAVDTPMLELSWRGRPDPQAARALIESRYALRRIAQPAEIADAILWLSSMESSFVTGIALAVDGGRTFH
ncbi:MAG TPA: SDR family NAD(P)-dependent oxidoreductase [Acetobacteraceae bacterium]|nr:SDR family NAD(P)-dependent oxidoreductase [Acetobacteraceae bacterium]